MQVVHAGRPRERIGALTGVQTVDTALVLRRVKALSYDIA